MRYSEKKLVGLIANRHGPLSGGRGMQIGAELVFLQVQPRGSLIRLVQ